MTYILYQLAQANPHIVLHFLVNSIGSYLQSRNLPVNSGSMSKSEVQLVCALFRVIHIDGGEKCNSWFQEYSHLKDACPRSFYPNGLDIHNLVWAETHLGA